MTAHYILPPRPTPPAAGGARRSFGAHGRGHRPLRAQRPRACARRSGSTADRVRVIPHGAFDYLTRLPRGEPLPAELEGAEGPVILFFGLLRPYKGLDVLLEAFRARAGRRALDRRQPADGRRAAARARGRAPAGRCASSPASSTTPRSRRSSAAPTSSSLPYRDAEHSGVLYTALAFGKPIVASAVGGFPELAAAHGRGQDRPARRRGRAGSGARASWSRTPTRAPSWSRRRPRRGRRVLLGRGRRRDPRALRASCSSPRAIIAACARDRLLDLRGPDRLHPRRLPARCSGCSTACADARPRQPARRGRAELPAVSLIVAAYDEEA